jgi:hypothetical protein
VRRQVASSGQSYRRGTLRSVTPKPGSSGGLLQRPT